MATQQQNAVAAQALDLSYSDIEKLHPTWPKQAIDDYFYKQSNINSIAALSDDQTDQVDQNTQDIADNKAAIIQNSLAIADNTNDISDNATNLNNHINDLTDAHDASAISYDPAGTSLSSTNAQGAITELDSDLTLHVNADTAHGTTGDVIGTDDYAQILLGGSVLLSNLVSDAVASTVSVDSPDASDLPTVITLANETKADVNQLVLDLNAAINQLNAFLDANKTAKQMSTV